jgi:tetratricopeptide (TPR) repeat protein
MRSLPNLNPLLLGAVVFLTSGGVLPAQKPKPEENDGSSTVQIDLARGNEELVKHRYQAAEADFRAALAADPRLTVRARFPLAVTLFALQKRDAARREFEAVRAETGDSPDVNYYLGRLDLQDGKLDSAIHNLLIASSKPPFPDTAYYLGDAYLRREEFASAEHWLRAAGRAEPTEARVPEALGVLYRATGRNAEAEQAFAAAAGLRRADLTATQQALDCDLSLGRQPLDEARRVCRKLFDPGDFSDLMTLGLLYGQHQDYADAIEAFRAAANLESDSYEVEFSLGLTYFRLKRYAEARAPLEKAVGLRPDLFEASAPLGAVLYALGDDLDAYPVLDRASRLRPESADVAGLLFSAAMNLAARSLKEHDTAGARQYLLRAAEARPGDPRPHQQLAEIYEAGGDQERARQERELAAQRTAH